MSYHNNHFFLSLSRTQALLIQVSYLQYQLQEANANIKNAMNVTLNEMKSKIITKSIITHTTHKIYV